MELLIRFKESNKTVPNLDKAKEVKEEVMEKNYRIFNANIP